jgi:O-antigen ligase
MRRLLLVLYLAALAVNWPDFPFNTRLADLIFIPAVAALASQISWRWPKVSALDVAAMAFVASSVPAVLVSSDLSSSAVELIRELYGVAIYATIAFAVAEGFSRTVAAGLALTGVVPAAIGAVYLGAHTLASVPLPVAVGQVMAIPYFGTVLRLSALTATPAMLACTITASLPFVWLRHAWAPGDRRGALLSLAVLIVALLTFSHSIAGVAVAMAIVGRDSWRHRPWLRPIVIASVAAIIVGANVAASVSPRSIGGRVADGAVYQYGVDLERTQIGNVEVTYQIISYWRLKQVAWQAFRDRPLTGVGLDRFHDVTEDAFQHGRLTQNYRAADPHSTLMGRLAETGIIGVLGLLAFLGSVFVAAYRASVDDQSPTIALAVFAGLSGLLVNSLNVDIMNFRFFWAAAGLVRGLSAIKSGGAGQSRSYLFRC